MLRIYDNIQGFNHILSGKIMLKTFSVKNFKNFNDKITLDLTASNYEFNKSSIFENDNIIKSAIIVGKNASGKSNLIIAIFDLISNITEFESGFFNYGQFRNLNSDDEIAEFEYEFILGEDIVKYNYGKEDKASIIFETITINGTEVAHIDRRHDNAATFRFNGTNETADVTENVFLCKYLENRLNNNGSNKLVSCYFKFVNFVKNMLCFTSLERNSYIGLIPSEYGDMFERIVKIDNNDLTKFQNFLLDLGICYNLELIKQGDKSTVGVKFERGVVPLADVASTGTKTLSLFYHWFTQINKVKFLAIDEFDAFYHFELSYSIVKKLRDLADIQVILTTHNTSLISNDLLRPDCYYTLDLNQNNIVKFSDATDKKLREIHNLEKMYRAGKFEHESLNIE
jgi:AAA15 family ATPase/GTPase